MLSLVYDFSSIHQFDLNEHGKGAPGMETHDASRADGEGDSATVRVGQF